MPWPSFPPPSNLHINLSLFVSKGGVMSRVTEWPDPPGSCVREVFTMSEMSDASVSVMRPAKKIHKNGVDKTHQVRFYFKKQKMQIVRKINKLFHNF